MRLIKRQSVCIGINLPEICPGRDRLIYGVFDQSFSDHGPPGSRIALFGLVVDWRKTLFGVFFVALFRLTVGFILVSGVWGDDSIGRRHSLRCSDSLCDGPRRLSSHT